MIRKLSVWILQFAIRRFEPIAPASVREWGAAMLREMDFVKGDGRALRWALGSARAFIKSAATAPMTAASDAPGRARLLETLVRRRTRFIYLSAFVAVPYFSFMAIAIEVDPVGRLVLAMLVAASLYFVAEVRKFRVARVHIETGTRAWLLKFRDELERQRAFHEASRVWVRAAVVGAPMLLGFIRFSMLNRHLATSAPVNVLVVLALCALAFRLNRKMKDRYELQIRELDAILSANS